MGYIARPSQRPMFVRAASATVALLILYSAAAFAGDAASPYDEAAWKVYRTAKREQVQALTDLWFPAWRPATVAQTYKNLADRYSEMNTSKCSPELKRHLNTAERTCTEIAEMFAAGGSLPDADAVLTALTNSKNYAPETMTSARGIRIITLMYKLSSAEETVAKSLKLE